MISHRGNRSSLKLLSFARSPATSKRLKKVKTEGKPLTGAHPSENNVIVQLSQNVNSTGSGTKREVMPASIARHYTYGHDKNGERAALHIDRNAAVDLLSVMQRFLLPAQNAVTQHIPFHRQFLLSELIKPILMKRQGHLTTN